jgi:hypothetical protein
MVKYFVCLEAELTREIREASAGQSSAPGCRSSCRGHSTVEEDQVGRHLLPCCRAMLKIVLVVVVDSKTSCRYRIRGKVV